MAAPLSGSPPYFLDELPAQCCSSTVLAPTLPTREAHIGARPWPSPDVTRFLSLILAPTRHGVPHTITDEAFFPFMAHFCIPLAQDRGMLSFIPPFSLSTSLRSLRCFWSCTYGAHAFTHIDDTLHTVSELTSNVFTYYLPPLPALPILLSMTSTLQLRPGEALGNRLTAELLLTPAPKQDACNGSRNDSGGSGTHSAPFLYATNRNDPSAVGDTGDLLARRRRQARAHRGGAHWLATPARRYDRG